MKSSFFLLACFIAFILSCFILHEVDARRLARKFPVDENMNFTQIVQFHGYVCETHQITTDDGYILTVFRIPHGRNEGKQVGSPRPAVILQHGLLDSAFTWILNMPNESLSYILADAGYDVWMGNSRGNIYSDKHVTLTTNDPLYWAFSWDEMAAYDIPALIGYVRQKTGNAQVAYIGHSQGTIQMFAALSTQPALAPQLSIFVGLGPVAYVGNIESEPMKILADIDAADFVRLFGIYDFLPKVDKRTNPLLYLLFSTFCLDCESCCASVIELLCGPHQGAFNDSRMPVVATHEPGGTSVQNMQKWSQGVLSNKFEKFDYGTQGNIQHYGQPTPPQYKLANIPASLPIMLFSGGEDILADPIDVKRLVIQLPKTTEWTAIPDYAHLDFAWALDAPSVVYASILAKLKTL